MKVSFSRNCLLMILPWMMISHQSQGVIVAGTSGTGYNNDTQAGLSNYLNSETLAMFPYWQNLVRVGNASGVYLGYNPNTSRGWVLSANHVAAPTSITVGGNTYTVQSSTRIGTSDLRLYEIGGGVSDPALPSLSSITLASSPAINGDFVLMFGRGFTNSTESPFTWETPGGSESNGMRWGTNTVTQLSTVDSHPYIVTNFSNPDDPSVTAFEAQGATGDSGGGLFIYRSGQWQLSGIAHFVDDGPDFLEPEESPTGDGIVNPSQFGDFTAYSDVHSHLVAIQGVTGTVIPEPSSLWLLLPGVGLLLLRKRGDDGNRDRRLRAD